jgi:hypothetical protein
MNSDLITLIANLALTLSFIVALVFGIFQVQAARRDRSERLTLDTLRNFQTRDFAELMQHVNSHHLPANRNEWNRTPAAEQVIFLQFAQEMESLGLLVAENLIDIDLVDKTIGSLVSTTWEKYKPMILDSRERLPDPFLAEYFQWLAEKIDDRINNNPRQPFYLKK